jgi:hypothetical protein
MITHLSLLHTLMTLMVLTQQLQLDTLHLPKYMCIMMMEHSHK